MKLFMTLFWLLTLFAVTAAAHEGHEHVAANPLQIEWGLKGAAEAINVHPLFVHFPIALLLAAMAFYFTGSVFKKEALLAAGKWNLLLGSLSAILTIWTGLKAAETVPHGGGTHEIMLAHQYLGFTVLTLSLALTLWVFLSKANIPAKGQGLFLALLVLMGGLLVQAADLGGRMVFLNGVGVGRKSMIQETAGHGYGGHEEYHEAAQHDHGSHSH